MKNYKQLMKELPSKSVVFAFGRFNPPTIGHELLFKVVKKLASAGNADHVIFASKTQDKKKNPLSVDRKIHYLKLMFPQTHFVPANEEVRTFIEAAKLLNKKYKNIIMVAGSDRVAEYTKLLNNYNGKEFNFDSIQVVSAGERDPDADDASGMSASKMRAAAVKGDYESFKKGLPSTVRDIDGKLLMNEIRTGMGHESIKEQIKFDVDEIREQYFRKEIFNIGDFVMVNEEVYEILDRGTNYVTVVNDNGETSKKWIQDCQTVEHIEEDIKPGYAPQEITFKGYTTKNLHHSGDAAKAFLDTIERYGKHDPVAVLNALKATDTYMKLNDMHLEQGKAPDELELKSWRDAHTKAKDSLQRIGEFPHHMDYWHNHEHEIQGMESDYTPETAGAEMNEELTAKTIKPADKLKVARIIASFLSVESAEQMSNPEQLINIALRKVKSKALNKDSLDMLHKMLNLADEVEIKYDTKLVPQKLKEDIDSRVTVDPKSGYNAAKDILRYKDFKKLMKMNKGEVTEAKVTDPFDHDDKVAPESPPDEKDEDSGIAPTASKVAIRDLENKGPLESEVGHALGHGDDSQLRRRKVNYQREEVEIEEDVASADYKVNPDTGRKSRAHVVTFANSKMGGKPDDTPDENEDEKEYKRTNKNMGEEAKKKKVDSPVKADPIGGGAVNHGFDAFFKEEEELEDIPEHELDAMADSVKDIEDVIDAYGDEELAIVDDEGEELEKDLKEEVEAINEVLSRMERIRAKMRFAKTKAVRERKAQIALKRHSNTTTINNRARKLAVKLMKERIAKKPLNKLSVGEKERIEKIIQKRKAVVNRLAMKLAPRVRKIENDRLSHNKYTKK